MIFVIFLGIIYVGMLGIATGNLVLMKRPKGVGETCFEVMIPARNEAENIGTVVYPLIEGGIRVTIFDDESTDDTAGIAQQCGALILRPKESLPVGWTGKNNACHQLSMVAIEPWTIFLDADTIPSENFVTRLSAFLQNCDPCIQVVSGFPKMVPGRGIEPAYLTWVSWILLATNPFGLVSATGKGHNRFTNGQFVAWRTDCLHLVMPYEQVKSEVLEDVKIGRLLGSQNIRVENINLTGILSVKMYKDVKDAVNGMSKNSCDIMGNPVASLFLVALLLVIAWGWLFCGYVGVPLFAMLLLGKLVTDRAVGAPLWIFPFAPFTITAGAITIIRSMVWKQKGKVAWKGRTY